MKATTKREQVANLLAEGKNIEALRIAKSFTNYLTKSEKDILAAGWQAHTNASFTIQIGKDPATLIAAASTLMVEKWGAQ